MRVYEGVVASVAPEAVALVDQLSLALLGAVEAVAQGGVVALELEVGALEREALCAHEGQLALQVGVGPGFAGGEGQLEVMRGERGEREDDEVLVQFRVLGDDFLVLREMFALDWEVQRGECCVLGG